MNKKIIIISAVIAIIIVSVLGVYFAQQNRSVSYLGSEGKNTIYGYRSNVNGVYFQGALLKGMDPKTTKDIGNGCVKDLNLVNCSGLFVQGADAKTFITIKPKNEKTFDTFGNYFSKDSKKVYFGYGTEIVKNADPKTFENIGGLYAKDSKNVYMGSNKIQGADLKTFEVMGDYFSKDLKNVYISGIRFVGVDPKTFTIMGDGYYVKDSQKVYYTNSISSQYIAIDADPKTAFAFPSVNGENSRYLKDKDSVYLNGVKLTNVDGGSFVYLGYYYSKDKNSAYYANMGPMSEPFDSLKSSVKGADLKTFELVGTSAYAKDKNNVYSGGKPNGAKPENCTMTNISGCQK